MTHRKVHNNPVNEMPDYLNEYTLNKSSLCSFLNRSKDLHFNFSLILFQNFTYEKRFCLLLVKAKACNCLTR